MVHVSMTILIVIDSFQQWLTNFSHSKKKFIYSVSNIYHSSSRYKSLNLTIFIFLINFENMLVISFTRTCICVLPYSFEFLEKKKMNVKMNKTLRASHDKIVTRFLSKSVKWKVLMAASVWTFIFVLFFTKFSQIFFCSIWESHH